jgi:uncharacterized protein (DUF1499 family)
MIKPRKIDVMSDFERPTPNSARAARAYSVGPQKLLDAVRRAVEGLPRWTLEGEDEKELRAVRRTRLLRFQDDVIVRVRPRGGGSEARFESRSRVGKGDLGQNPRNLEELLAAVNRELSG